MSKIIVENSPPLKGTVRISGAKNSALPIIAATLLATEDCILEEVPNLTDVDIICKVLESLGSDVLKLEGNKLKINSCKINNVDAPYELVRKMRASFLVMGPLLAREGKARISMPGGCAIGTRPIDLHLKGFVALGAKIEQGHGYVEAYAEKLIGARIYLDFPSVGATENLMMAATLAEGETILENVAQEPEIIDLANFLNKLGASITGAGTNVIKIKGVEKLTGTTHTIIPDRIEAGTFMVAAAITGGEILIENVITNHIKAIISKLRETGATVIDNGTSVKVIGNKNIQSVDIKTLPYPGFPTDMQAQFMTLMSVSNGTSIMIETVFENRFMHVAELKRLGADISIDGRSAVVKGKGKEVLLGAEVKSTDLRAGASLILAGLISEGITEVSEVHHIDRGYPDIEQKLTNLGAKIRREQ